MTVLNHLGEGLDRLLKIARADADALRVDLVDIERARAAAEASLLRLDEIARREEETLKDGASLDACAHLDGARERRLQLRATVLTLADAEARARNQLKLATTEIKKFEHLVSLNARSQRPEEAKGERLSGDDPAARLQAS